MSERMDDDELRAMLTARADRVSPGAARKVLAAVRDAGRGPAGGTGFALLPIAGSGRRGVAPAGWAVAALVAVIALAVLGGRLERAPVASTGAPDGGATPAATIGSVGPSASRLQELTRQLSVDRLRLAMADGSLDGRLVVIDGTLDRLTVPCPAPGGPQCVSLVLRGSEGIPITDPDGLRLKGDVRFPLTGPLVFAGGSDTLTFLGRWAHGVETPIGTTELLADGRIEPAGLWAVHGWLVVGGIHSCPFIGPGGTPCPGPGPWLTDDRPFDNGMLATDAGTAIGLAPHVTGLTRGQVVTPGPFLVRRVSSIATCDGASGVDCRAQVRNWEVVAVLDPRIMVRVVVP